jgi:tripartite-type tricarboxylate transporter receptor subunit TctC
VKAVALLILSLAAAGACAQAPDPAYPSKLVRWVLPFSAGSGQDTLGRLVAPKLGERLGQTVIIDNKAGAGGLIGFEYIAKAAPDGYQIMMGNNSMLILSAIRPTPYDPLKDFAPVSMMGNGYTMLMVHASVPVNSLRELIAHSRANPGRLNYGSPAVGTFGHLATELFKNQSGADLTHIPHKGIVAATQGLVAGDVQFLLSGADLAMAPIKSGKVRVLATVGSKRAPSLPDTPTTAEQGVMGDLQLWYGLFAPAGTRRDIVTRLNGETARILADSSLREDLLKRGIDPSTGTPEAFSDLLRKEMATWRQVIKVGNIKAE